MKIKLKELILIGIFAAITAICAQISIPTPFFGGIPITLQVLAVFLSAIVLGSKCGALSQLIYILIGIIGVPVFTNFTGGLHVVLGKSGGFIISFPLMAFMIGYLMEKTKKDSRLFLGFFMMIGLIICYFLGSAWLSFILKISFLKAFVAGVLPFILFDLVKIIVSSLVGYQIRLSLIKANLIKKN